MFLFYLKTLQQNPRHGHFVHAHFVLDRGVMWSVLMGVCNLML